MRPKPVLPEGVLSEEELRKLKKSWKLADKITLIKHLATAPGTKFAGKALLTSVLLLGGIGYGYKMYINSKFEENRAAGLYLSDIEERKLVESLQKY